MLAAVFRGLGGSDYCTDKGRALLFSLLRADFCFAATITSPGPLERFSYVGIVAQCLEKQGAFTFVQLCYSWFNFVTLKCSASSRAPFLD
eukprot:5715224-Amphidinium_carterae.1